MSWMWHDTKLDELAILRRDIQREGRLLKALTRPEPCTYCGEPAVHIEDADGEAFCRSHWARECADAEAPMPT